jgi:hypothetical protein
MRLAGVDLDGVVVGVVVGVLPGHAAPRKNLKWNVVKSVPESASGEKQR